MFGTILMTYLGVSFYQFSKLKKSKRHHDHNVI